MIDSEAIKEAIRFLENQKPGDTDETETQETKVVEVAEETSDPLTQQRAEVARRRKDFYEQLEVFYRTPQGEALLRSKAEKAHMTYEDYKAQFTQKIEEFYKEAQNRKRSMVG